MTKLHKKDPKYKYMWALNEERVKEYVAAGWEHLGAFLVRIKKGVYNNDRI